MSDCRLTAGSLLTGSQKAGLSVTAMPSHAVSAKSQTRENKAYHVMSYHFMPAIGGQVGDEGLESHCPNNAKAASKPKGPVSVVSSVVSIQPVSAELVARNRGNQGSPADCGRS